MVSITEHVSVFIAIVIGLAVSVLATNFYRLLVAGRRVKWDWLSPLLATLMLFVTVSYWWASFYWYAQARTLTVGAFLPDLTNVILVFLAVAGVLPESVPARGLDLRRFYLDRAPYVYTMLALGIAEACAINVYRFAKANTLQGWIDALGVNPLYMVMFAVLIFTRRVWLHTLILTIALTGSVSINLGASIGG